MQIVIKLNLGFYDELGTLIRNPVLVVRHYAYSRDGLGVDLLANAPVDLFCLFWPSEQRLLALSLLRLLHVLRLNRIYWFFQ